MTCIFEGQPPRTRPFPGNYHQSGACSMAMLVSWSVPKRSNRFLEDGSMVQDPCEEVKKPG